MNRVLAAFPGVLPSSDALVQLLTGLERRFSPSVLILLCRRSDTTVLSHIGATEPVLSFPDLRALRAGEDVSSCLARFIEELSALRCDLAWIHTFPRESPHACAYLCLLAGIPRRIGVSREFAGAVLSKTPACGVDEDAAGTLLDTLGLDRG